MSSALTSSAPQSRDMTEFTPSELPPNIKLQAGYIRLVRVLPRPSSDSKAIVECETRIFASSMGVPYIALSYAWGYPRLLHQITVDGRRRKIAHNLWQFLSQVNAKPTQPTCWLWIDALSIDQANPDEKRHQVDIMSRIFGRATAVLAWLGPAQRESDAAMRALSADSFHRYQTWGPFVDQAICGLCERPYWKRLWVFQELKHAREIVLLCGSTFLPWACFEGCRGAIHRLRFQTDSKIPARMIDLRTRRMDTSLWSLLETTQDMLCEDPRDRAYALLSIATEGHEGIDVDYGPEYFSAQSFDVEYFTSEYSALRLALVHRILRNKYATTRPTSLSAVVTDCEFLETVFRLRTADMFQHGDTSLRSKTGLAGKRTWQKYIPLSAWRDWASAHHHIEVAWLVLHASPPPPKYVSTSPPRFIPWPLFVYSYYPEDDYDDDDDDDEEEDESEDDDEDHPFFVFDTAIPPSTTR